MTGDEKKVDKRRLRKRVPQDATSLTPHYNDKQLHIPKGTWMKDEENDTDEYYAFRRLTNKEMREMLGD